MKYPAQWNKAELHAHLQHALDLELWTIPLYLTALYSIKGLKNLKPPDYPVAAKMVFSVVVQEMLHLELVCNISNALGHSPKFTLPVYDEHKGIPFIHPSKKYLPKDLQGYSLKPQALNVDSLKLFCAIELPHPKREIAWEHEHSYSSIADLYEALRVGVNALWDECYVGDRHNVRQKDTFKEYHNTYDRHHGFSQAVFSRETASKAIDAIIEQGEGADSKHVPAEFRPAPLEGGEGSDAAWYRGDLSHYQKFRTLLHHPHALPPIYSADPNPRDRAAQAQLESAFTDFLKEMQTNFTSPGPEMTDAFWRKMYFLSEAITAVWESGSCPTF